MVLAAIFMLAGTTYAGEKTNVPAAVREAFQKTYPGAEKLKWDKEDGRFEASFEYKEQEMSVLYNANGTVAETETEIPVTDLPKEAYKYASGKGKVKEAAKIVSADGTVTYEAEVGKSDLIFDDNGNFLQEKTDKE